MPLEISEISVRLAVGSTPTPVTQRKPDGAAVGDNGRLSPKHYEELVQACTQSVLDALRRIEDR